jgi:hypothetical protein
MLPGRTTNRIANSKFQNKLVADCLDPRFRVPFVDASQLDQASLKDFIKSGKAAQTFLIHSSRNPSASVGCRNPTKTPNLTRSPDMARSGRKPIMIAALSLYFVLVYPLFSWLHDNPSFGSSAAVQIALCGLPWCFLWSDFHGNRRAVRGSVAVNRTWYRLQLGGHDFPRFRAVLRNLTDRGYGLTNSAVVPRDVRRCDWHCCHFFPR